MSPDERRRLHDALTPLNAEPNKALAATDAELNALLLEPGADDEPAQ